MTTPNAELAYRTLDHIDAHPEDHDQDVWIQKVECGTAGCFAGWACLLSGDVADINSDDDFEAEYVRTEDGERIYIPRRAAEVLGINYDRANEYAHELFRPENTREDLGRLVADIFGPRPGGEPR